MTFVASLNLTRRQLSPQALGLAGARIKHIFEEEAKKRQVELAGTRPNKQLDLSLPGGQGNITETPHGEKTRDDLGKFASIGKSTSKAAELVGSSRASVERASAVLKKGSEEVVKAVEKGEIGLRPASQIAQLPKEQQPEALKQALAPKPKPEPKKTARKLYEFLGLNSAAYARWAKMNIVENRFAEENRDWFSINIHVDRDKYNPKPFYRLLSYGQLC